MDAGPNAVATEPMATVEPPVIETRGLRKRFAGVEAVAGIDLAVPPGGVYGFLGPNGAGKTTTIRLLLGLLSPTGGVSRVFGEVVEPGAPVLARIGALIERPAFYPYLSARENLAVFGTARGISSSVLSERIRDVLDQVGLAAAARRKAGGFSTGMLQRLALGLVLLDRPRLVILDEPTNGLDPNGVVDVRQLIAGMAASGATVFLSTHVLPEVEQLCNRVAILRDGVVVAEGAPGSLLRENDHLFVRFDTAREAEAARALLGRAATGTAPGPNGGAALLVDAPAARASTINRTLAEASLHPAELTIRRQSLEAIFRELTAEPEPSPVPSDGRPSTAPSAPATGSPS
jgi:ABC-2 type transport system ATP-binding protein